jgi:hypothetical protein
MRVQNLSDVNHILFVVSGIFSCFSIAVIVLYTKPRLPPSTSYLLFITVLSSDINLIVRKI